MFGDNAAPMTPAKNRLQSNIPIGGDAPDSSLKHSNGNSSREHINGSGSEKSKKFVLFQLCSCSKLFDLRRHLACFNQSWNCKQQQNSWSETVTVISVPLLSSSVPLHFINFFHIKTWQQHNGKSTIRLEKCS